MKRTRNLITHTFDISMEQAAHFSTVGMFVIGVIFTLYFGAAILIPVCFAAFISIILRPAVRTAKKIKIPESISAAIVMLLLIGLLVAGFVRLIGPASEWIERAPSALADARRDMGPIADTIETAQNASEEIENLTKDENADNNEVVVRGPSLIERSVSYTWAGVTQTILTFTLLYFFLALGPKTFDSMLHMIPVEGQRQYFRDLITAVQYQLTSYLRALAIIYAGLGTLTALAMYLLDVPNPILWGVLAFVLQFVPYIGPFVVALIIGLVSVLTFDEPIDILKPVMAYGFLTVMEGFFVTPNILGRRLTMSPFAILLSIIFWTWIWGFIGTVLAVPIYASLKIIVDHAIGLKSVQEAAREAEATLEAVQIEEKPESESAPDVSKA